MSIGEETRLLDRAVASPARSPRVFTAVATISVLLLGCVGLIVFAGREGIALGVEQGDRGNLGVLDHAEVAPSSTDFALGVAPTTQPDENLSAGPRSQPLLSLFMKGDTRKISRGSTRARSWIRARLDPARTSFASTSTRRTTITG